MIERATPPADRLAMPLESMSVGRTEAYQVTPAVSSQRSDDVVTVSVTGDFDLYTCPAVRRAIDEALTSAPRSVEVDLTDVHFLDSSGIALLLGGRRDAEARGVGYRVRGADGAVRRVLEFTGVLAHLCGDGETTGQAP